MRAIHVSRQTIETAAPPEECIIISMVDPKKPEAAIPKHSNILAIHRVEPFHDVDMDGERILRAASTVPVEYYTAFTADRAQKIAEFVKSFERKMPPLIVAHCEAGICRSAGVVAAIQSYYRLDGISAFVTGIPNRLVFRLTYEALQGSPLVPWEKV